MNSFDIVSWVNLQEVIQALRDRDLGINTAIYQLSP